LRVLQQLNDVHQRPADLGLKEIRQTRWFIALLTAVLITAAATFFINWMISGVLWLGLVFLVVAQLLVGAVYYVSEFVKSLQPYQLLFESLFYLTIPPAFAFFLQSDEWHLFLTLVVIALIPAYFAYRLLNQIQNFGHDEKFGNKTVVVKVGWDKGMVFHNALILLTFVIFALTVFLGLPWFILWPVFLVLPIGIFEIWLMERVRRGAKPHWIVMKIASASVLFLPIYLLAFAFWIR
jgi:1,4-dihydroxy-2-naphthoate octaprenyltransferase